MLGYAVSVTLQLTTVETMRPLQIESMKCLQSLCWCSSHELDAVPVDVQPISDGARQCCQVVASFLPGIVTSIAKVIVGDSKQGQVSDLSAVIHILSDMALLYITGSFIGKLETIVFYVLYYVLITGIYKQQVLVYTQV